MDCALSTRIVKCNRRKQFWSNKHSSTHTRAVCHVELLHCFVPFRSCFLLHWNWGFLLGLWRHHLLDFGSCARILLLVCLPRPYRPQVGFQLNSIVISAQVGMFSCFQQVWHNNLSFRTWHSYHFLQGPWCFNKILEQQLIARRPLARPHFSLHMRTIQDLFFRQTWEDMGFRPLLQACGHNAIELFCSLFFI